MKLLRNILIYFVIFAAIVTVYYFFVLPSYHSNISLSHPTLNHWFGTDINGTDVFINSLEAFIIELFTLVIVLFIIWTFGLLLGSITYLLNLKGLREFFLNFIHYMATLPILLIALFILIIFGGGFINSVLILSFSIIPTQALLAFNQLHTADNEEFLIAKRSYGISKTIILRNHLLPYILKNYNNYTLSRIPEIIMMDIALNFLGLGIQSPYSSIGRMLFDGLSFMFSAWWLWGFPCILILFLYLIITNYDSKYCYK